MHHLVRRRNSCQRPRLLNAVNLLGKQVKADLGYWRERLQLPIRQTERRIILSARSEFVEYTNGGKEDRDNGLLLDHTQSVLEFRICGPLHLPNPLKEGVRLIPRYDHLERIITLPV